MFENLNFSLSSLCVQPAQRAELASLYTVVDQRWNQKFDRLSLLVTVRAQGTLVAAGLVHDSIVAPTSSMNAVELGCMAVRAAYRRLGIRQHVTSLRLAHALRAGRTPISVIDSQNPASLGARAQLRTRGAAEVHLPGYRSRLAVGRAIASGQRRSSRDSLVPSTGA